MATCSNADSVLEASALIQSNSEKLDIFVNGASSEFVQLGTGDPTPVVRNLVNTFREDIEQVIDSIIPAGVASAITSSYIDSLFA